MEKKQIQNNRSSGFTLIEIMVSVAIFAIVVTSGMGALTMILKTYRYAQSEKKSADSLSYVLENMTREIRLGHNYYSEPSLSLPDEDLSRNNMVETSSGALIGFKASDNRGYIIYRIENDTLHKKHFKENGDVVDNPLTDSSQVLIDSARVTVMNAEATDDMKQPLVWVQILAHTPGKDDSKVIQTLISQRDLDI